MPSGTNDEVHHQDPWRASWGKPRSTPSERAGSTGYVGAGPRDVHALTIQGPRLSLLTSSATLNAPGLVVRHVYGLRERAVTRENGKTPALDTDAQLVERVRLGDRRAFERLVRRYLPEAHCVARMKLGGDPDDADDVCQEAFVTALQKIEDCRNPDRFRAWLFTIVRNKAHNYRGYLAARRSQPLYEASTVASDEDASALVESHELQDDLSAALEELTELQREVFVRFDMEGRPHGEIADVLGISPNASRFHLHVARRALRPHLTAYPIAWSR